MERINNFIQLFYTKFQEYLGIYVDFLHQNPLLVSIILLLVGGVIGVMALRVSLKRIEGDFGSKIGCSLLIFSLIYLVVFLILVVMFVVKLLEG